MQLILRSLVSLYTRVYTYMLAAILVPHLKLYKKLAYRLARLYQALSALAMGLVFVMQVMFINYDDSPNTYTVFGFLELYTEWMKLLFTMWVTFHLFCFAEYSTRI